MGTTTKRPHQTKSGNPGTRVHALPYRLANSWKGLLRVHHDMQAATGEDKRCGPHPRVKKVSLPKVSLLEEPDRFADSVQVEGTNQKREGNVVEHRRADYTPRHYRQKGEGNDG